MNSSKLGVLESSGVSVFSGISRESVVSPPSSDTFVIVELALTLLSESNPTTTSSSSELLQIRTALLLFSIICTLRNSAVIVPVSDPCVNTVKSIKLLLAIFLYPASIKNGTKVVDEVFNNEG